MRDSLWLRNCSSAFRLMIATSWLAPAPWREHQESAVLKSSSCDIQWQEYLNLVRRHQTAALSWTALKSFSGLTIPEEVKRELRKIDQACRLNALRQTAVLAEVLRDFQHAEIPVIPLKGPLLSLELYGDPGLRQSCDLDFLVVKEDASRAAKRLEAMGWQIEELFDSPSLWTPRQIEAFWRSKRHINCRHPQKGISLELHWRIPSNSPEQTAGQWHDSRESTWSGAHFRLMNPIDLTLYLCHHGSDHGWFRAKWLGDMARIHASGYVDWQAAFNKAHASDCERPLLLCLRLLEELYGLPVPHALRGVAADLPRFLPNQVKCRIGTLPELPPRTLWARLSHRFSLLRYRQLLRPLKLRRRSFLELAICPKDFGVIRLPDRLFWVYVPLRPVLWAWRLLRG